MNNTEARLPGQLAAEYYTISPNMEYCAADYLPIILHLRIN